MHKDDKPTCGIGCIECQSKIGLAQVLAIWVMCLCGVVGYQPGMETGEGVVSVGQMRRVSGGVAFYVW